MSTNMPNASWRRMLPQDIDSVLQVADQVHPDLPEDKEVFAERLRLFPEGCLVLVNHHHQPHNNTDNTENDDSHDEGDERICGYAISHPLLTCHRPPALNSLLGVGETSFSHAEQYYIHDLAILPEFRGRGHATESIGMLLEVARRAGYESTCLVSVYGTTAFWGHFGFMPEPADATLLRKLREYGPDATYLVHQTRQ